MVFVKATKGQHSGPPELMMTIIVMIIVVVVAVNGFGDLDVKRAAKQISVHYDWVSQVVVLKLMSTVDAAAAA